MGFLDKIFGKKEKNVAKNKSTIKPENDRRIKLNPKGMKSFSNAEYFALSQNLEQHHVLFSKFWQLGKPYFTEQIDTAAIVFDKKTGEKIRFIFNPDFWKSLTPYEASFIVCHELLHVILRHGKRIRSAKHKDLANIAADIVVNHTLVRDFAFDRKRISNQAELCWIDTVFKDFKPTPDDDKTMEYYYKLLLDNTKVVNIQLILCDSHEAYVMDGNGKATPIEGLDAKDMAEIFSSLPNEDLEKIEKLCKQHKPQAGKEQGDRVWEFLVQYRPKRKWESIIKRWSMVYTKSKFNEEDQWVLPNRRLWLLRNEELMIPSSVDQETEKRFSNKDKCIAYFFMDTSGSCVSYAERFFNCVNTLPRDVFDLIAYSFDTKTYEVDLKSGRLSGGGGTEFYIMEDQIQDDIKKGKIRKYPDAVFVITDGFGSAITPQHPDRWNWLMTEGNMKEFIPAESAIHELTDFE